MKHPNLLFLSAILFTSCSKPIDKSQYPTLVVDESHQFQPTKTSTAYRFVPASGIRLETGQFPFKYGTSPATPNMIQVILGKSQLYKLSRPTVTNLYVLDRTTLEPLRGSSFSGFRSGDSGMLMIGHLGPDSSHGKESIFVSWVGKFEVK